LLVEIGQNKKEHGSGCQSSKTIKEKEFSWIFGKKMKDLVHNINATRN
jgi:hypothetical protein